MKNLRKHVNEFDQARHRYEVRLKQEKRTEERKRRLGNLAVVKSRNLTN